MDIFNPRCVIRFYLRYKKPILYGLLWQFFPPWIYIYEDILYISSYSGSSRHCLVGFDLRSSGSIVNKGVVCNRFFLGGVIVGFLPMYASELCFVDRFDKSRVG